MRGWRSLPHLSCASLVGVVGVHAAVAVALELGVVDEGLDGVHVDDVDLGDLVTDAEALEEVHKGDARLLKTQRRRVSVRQRIEKAQWEGEQEEGEVGYLDGGEMGDESHVAALLDSVGGEEGPSSGAA